jgi:hypothetical protein
MFSEPQTPGNFLQDSFSDIKSPASNLRLSDTSEISIIRAKLNRRLGPEYVSQWPAPGGGPSSRTWKGGKSSSLSLWTLCSDLFLSLRCVPGHDAKTFC